MLRDVNLSIMPGDFVGLLGPSGSGKSTLLRSLVGAVDLYHGEVIVEGQSVARKRPRTGYVPQLETIDWNFPVTAWEVVMMGCTADSPAYAPGTGRQCGRGAWKSWSGWASPGWRAGTYASYREASSSARSWRGRW